MSISFTTRLCRAFRRYTLSHDAQLRRPDFVLLLRLENLQLLSNRLGQAGIAHLHVHMTMCLSAAMRPHDLVDIVAPGIFAVRLCSASDVEAMAIAERLQSHGQIRVAIAGHQVTPALTGVLISGHLPKAITASQMIAAGQECLAHVSANDLGQIGLYEACSLRDALPVSVAAAAETGQIEAFFQPQLCCNTGRVTGFETLARWNHPTRGILPPAAFMPGMTDADHSALTMQMLSQALAALKMWDATGRDVPTVSLNISNCELADPDCATRVLWELDRHGIAPCRLVVEVLESVGPITSDNEAQANLARLAGAGCRLDLDDFGTGYASLDAIRQFGVHRIKIDRSFITGCDIDPGQQRMVLAILALAEHLGIAALAEGVETREEHSYLAQLGCDEVQGYAIARPMRLEETLGFLDRHSEMAGSLPQIEQRKTG